MVYVGSSRHPDKRVLRPESLQNMRVTDPGVVDKLSAMITRSQVDLRNNMEATLEWLKVGCVTGIVKDADGSVLFDNYAAFGVTAPTEVAFNLTVSANGAVRKLCADIMRAITTSLGGLSFTGIHALCHSTFIDALIANSEVRATYLGQQEASQLRGGSAYITLNFGGITFEEYRGIGANTFIEANKARFFPLGVNGLFRQHASPGDGFDWMVGNAQAVYSRLTATPQAVTIEAETCPITVCTIPEVLIQGRLGA